VLILHMFETYWSVYIQTHKGTPEPRSQGQSMKNHCMKSYHIQCFEDGSLLKSSHCLSLNSS